MRQTSTRFTLGLLLIGFSTQVLGFVSAAISIEDESGQAITTAQIRVNADYLKSVTSARYSASIPEARRYEVRVVAPGYFDSLHSFSEQERKHFDGQFPTVTLVRKVPGRVMLAFGGDAMLGRRYHQPNPGDPQLLGDDDRLQKSQALLTPIKPYLGIADYVSVNLESPVFEREYQDRSSKNVTFYSYPETLEALTWAGVDYVSLGNNHLYDYLAPGLQETFVHLSNSTLGHSGAGMSETAALQPHRTRILDQDYSFFSYVGWRGRVTPSQVAEGDNKGGAALGTLKNVRASLQSTTPHRVSVVASHGSEEYSEGPTDVTRKRLHAAIDAGADVVVAHHPHVLHGFELYKGKLIAYSLGNFLFDQYIYETQRSALLYVWMDGEEFHRAEVVPLYIKSYRPTPALGQMRDYVLRRLGHLSSLEGVFLDGSGGHAVIQKNTARKAKRKIALPPSPDGRLLELPTWSQKLSYLEFDRAGINYQIGRDWWALGDHEQEAQFGLVDRSWKFSHPDSGISTELSLERYALKVKVPPGENAASVGQQYFMRVWDGQPKTIAVQAYAPEQAEVQVCLELRTLTQTTSEGRDNPEVHCLDRLAVEAGDWRQLQFDFSPPERRNYRGMRIRFDVYGGNRDNKSVYLDDIRFINWELTGTSRADQSLTLPPFNRYNILRLTGGGGDASCCQVFVQ